MPHLAPLQIGLVNFHSWALLLVTVVAIATGIRYLRFSRDYLWLLLLGSLFGFASASLRAMLSNLTSDVLGGGSA